RSKRDWVQTCALPIFTRSNNTAAYQLALSDKERNDVEDMRRTTHDRRTERASPSVDYKPTRLPVHFLTNVVYGSDDPEMQRLDRSEERRVGKEARDQW